MTYRNNLEIILTYKKKKIKIIPISEMYSVVINYAKLISKTISVSRVNFLKLKTMFLVEVKIGEIWKTTNTL